MRVGFGYEIPGLRWRLFQAAVMFAVMWWIHTEAGPGFGNAPAFIGMCCAFAGTWLLGKVYDWSLRLWYWQRSRALLRAEDSTEHRQLSRREPWL